MICDFLHTKKKRKKPQLIRKTLPEINKLKIFLMLFCGYNSTMALHCHPVPVLKSKDISAESGPQCDTRGLHFVIIRGMYVTQHQGTSALGKSKMFKNFKLSSVFSSDHGIFSGIPFLASIGAQDSYFSPS